MKTLFIAVMGLITLDSALAQYVLRPGQSINIGGTTVSCGGRTPGQPGGGFPGGGFPGNPPSPVTACSVVSSMETMHLFKTYTTSENAINGCLIHTNGLGRYWLQKYGMMASGYFQSPPSRPQHDPSAATEAFKQLVCSGYCDY